MSPGKHGPNRLNSYIRTHANIIQQYIAEGFVVGMEGMDFISTDGQIVLEGTVLCLGGLRVEVLKRISILVQEGTNPLVQTTTYRYQVTLGGVGTVFRYDSPHPHRDEHHVHRHDVLNGDRGGSIDYIYNEDDIPTLGEVIGEVRDWYYANFEALEGAPAGG